MAKKIKKLWITPVIFAFLIYVFVTARPIFEEVSLSPRWITSLESNIPIYPGVNTRVFSDEIIPFILGEYFGYFRDDGRFILKEVNNNYISISDTYWTEYGNTPSSVQVMNYLNEPVFTIDTVQGYPVFFNDQVFIIGIEQNAISSVGSTGEILWTHDFPAPITCIDAAGAHVLVGTLDGTVELLDSAGIQVFTPFEPGGSRLPVITGCAISSDASRLAIISGIDEQRFLLLERAGENYRVIYHEFLGTGFRRPVHISFVDNDSRIAFEREGGLGIFEIASRTSHFLPLNGEVEILDNSGGDTFLFLITGTPESKHFVTIRYPASIIMDARFQSESVFLRRRGNIVYLGSDHSIASFLLERK